MLSNEVLNTKIESNKEQLEEHKILITIGIRDIKNTITELNKSAQLNTMNLSTLFNIVNGNGIDGHKQLIRRNRDLLDAIEKSSRHHSKTINDLIIIIKGDETAGNNGILNDHEMFKTFVINSKARRKIWRDIAILFGIINISGWIAIILNIGKIIIK